MTMTMAFRVATALVLTAGTTLHAGEEPGWPRFSWDTVPVCIHFGKRSGPLTQDELEFVARTSNLVCLEKAHAMDRLGSTEKGIAHDAKRLKALNKNMKVLFYWNGVLNYPFFDAAKELRRHPTWTLRDKQGNPIYKGGDKGGTEQYNLLDPGFREWWAACAGKAVRESNCDGVFMDAVPQVETRILRQLGGGAPTQRALSSAVVDMMKQAKAAMGKDGILVYNGLRSHDRRTRPIGEKFLPFADGAMVEHFTAMGSTSKEAIASDIAMIAEAGKKRNILVVKGWPDPTFTWMNSTKMKLPAGVLAAEAKKKITFSLACFLLAAQEHSYFCYSWGYREMHCSLVEYPEFSRRLGRPKGDCTRDGWQFSRTFEHAAVWADVAKRTARIDWK